jgi:hypothetical protein
VQATTTRPKITATADGEGVVSHAGSRLLADVADRTTLTAQLSEVLGGLCKPRARHDPGRVLVDMAVAVADGATTISDVAVLADQAALFGCTVPKLDAPPATCRFASTRPRNDHAMAARLLYLTLTRTLSWLALLCRRRSALGRVPRIMGAGCGRSVSCCIVMI